MGRQNDTEGARSWRHTVVVTRFSALGDVAMTIPVVYDVCRANPDTRFVMVTKHSTAGMFVNPPANLTVEGIDLRQKPYRGFPGLLRLYAMLRRRYAMTHIVDLHDVLRTKVLRALGRLTGVKTSAIVKNRARNRRLLREAARGVELPMLETSFDRYADAFARLGFEWPRRFTAVASGADAPLAPLSEVTPPKAPGERWIGIAPFAAHPTKVYPLDLMEQVVMTLGALPSVRLFFMGAGPEEAAQLERWAAKIPGSVSMASRRWGFAVELELMRRLDVMLAMDSANMHLASLVGLPVVSIWGATHPCFGFAGWRQGTEGILGSALECRPCSVFGNRPCRRGDYECLRLISPERVVDAVTNLLTKNG